MRQRAGQPAAAGSEGRQHDHARRPDARSARARDSLAKAANAAALIEAMKTAYPNAGLMVALDIGAKVNKGEMKW
mgnify:CR=1 FL=1